MIIKQIGISQPTEVIIEATQNKYVFYDRFYLTLVHSANQVAQNKFNLQQVTDYAYKQMVVAKNNADREVQRIEREQGIQKNLAAIRKETGYAYVYTNGVIIRNPSNDIPALKSDFDKALEFNLAAYVALSRKGAILPENIFICPASGQDWLGALIQTSLENRDILPTSAYRSAFDNLSLTEAQRSAVLYDLATNKALSLVQTMRSNLEEYDKERSAHMSQILRQSQAQAYQNRLLTQVEPRVFFKGQQNHPLTEDEFNFLVTQKLDIQTDTYQKRQIIINSLRKMAEFPTGRIQLRQIMYSSIPKFRIECNTACDAICDARRGDAFFDGTKVALHSRKFNGSDVLENVGSALLHEMLHNRQSQTFGNAILGDMETQALTAQLSFEMNMSKNQSYYESYEYNRKIWQDVLDGKRARPTWSPPFEPVIGLSEVQIQEAKEAYIHQMASTQTQAQFMQDFMMSHQAMIDGEFSMPVTDYQGINCHLFYDSYAIKYDCSDFNIAPEMVHYLQSTYPALDVNKIKLYSQQLATEHSVPNLYYRSKLGGGLVPLAHTDVYEEVENHYIYNQLNAISGETPHHTARLKFDFLKQTELSVPGKFYLMSNVINEHKYHYPDSNSPEGLERARMIQELRDLTGFKGLKTVQNSGTLRFNAQILQETEAPDYIKQVDFAHTA